MMLLSPADKMNDKVEKGWGKNVFMTCFSYSKYEDVAMWMNYGKRSPDAVRVRIDASEIEIISTNQMGIRELVVQAEKRLREIEDRQRRDTVTPDDKRFLRALGGDLRSAAKTINHHKDRHDYKQNPYKLARLEIIDPRRLAELSLIDKGAYSYLEALREIAASSKAEWKHRISHVRKYAG